MEALSRNWWIFLIRGIAAILVALSMVLFPITALVVLVSIVSAYFLVDGIFTTLYAIQHRTQPRWWVHLLEGVLGIIAGIAALILGPGDVGFILLYVIAFWAIMTGIMEIAFAISMRQQIDNEWWLALGGVLSVLFGVMVILFPGAGALTILSIIAGYLFLFGVLMVLLAFRLRGAGTNTPIDMNRRTTTQV